MSDPPLWQWLLLFVVAAALLVRAGITVAGAADEIGTRTRLGGLFAGLLLLAAATSLPEIVTVTSAALEGAPDLAAGSVFGSSMGNMAVLAVIDLVHRQRLLVVVEVGHARVASAAIALTALAVLGVTTPEGLTLGWVGTDTILVAVVYVAAVAWFRRTHAPVPAGAAEPLPEPTGMGAAEHPREPLGPAIRRFALGATVILVAGPMVALSGEGIADEAGIGETFVGVALIAVATSLPELAASLAAVRIGAFDLAVGNLFGSNAFNMLILFGADLAYTDGPLLTGADPAQAVAGVGAIGLMALALAVIVHGEETRIRRFEPDALVLLLAYLGALAAVWAASA